MHKRDFPMRGAFVAVIFFALILGAWTLVAALHANADADDTAHFAAESMARWMSYGILPQMDYVEFDNTITYNEFAQIMNRLLGITIHERYTQVAGHLQIRRHEGFTIVREALGQAPQATDRPTDYLTYGELSDFLDSTIQFFFHSETYINLEGIYLEKALVIRFYDFHPIVKITNISGTGDIVLAGGRDGRVLAEAITISGSIVAAQTGHPIEVNISRSKVGALLFLGQGSGALFNCTEINSVSLSENSSISTIFLAKGQAYPNVTINGSNTRLLGSFNRVESGLQGVVIHLDGGARYFYSSGNEIIVGAAEIANIIAGANVFGKAAVSFFNPSLIGLSCSEMIGAVKDEFKRLEELLFLIEDDLNFSLNHNFRNVGFQLTALSEQVAQTPPIIVPPPYIPEPPPGPDLIPIDALAFRIMPPNLLPPHLLPNFVNTNVQTQITGTNFTGTIAWSSAAGTAPMDGTFTRGVQYSATIVLAPNLGHRFNLNLNDITIEIYGNLWFGWINMERNFISNYRISLEIIFDPTGPWLAGPYSIRPLAAPSDRIYIISQYLGILSVQNFVVHFGANAINPISVSPHCPTGGHYVLTLDQVIDFTGETLTVEIVQPLPHHIQYPAAAKWTTPAFVPINTRILDAYAHLGGFVSATDFPARPFEIRLAHRPATGLDDLLYISRLIAPNDHRHDPAGFYLSPVLELFLRPLPEIYRVYVVSGQEFHFAGELEIRP